MLKCLFPVWSVFGGGRRASMAAYVALLRAVNLGGPTQVRMAALAELVERAGWVDVQTLLQSGNVVFRGAAADPSEIEQGLESLAARRLGLTTDFFVRTGAEWHAIASKNPFSRAAAQDPAHLVVTLLKDAPSSVEWKQLAESIRGREEVRGEDRHAYVVYPDGIGRSKLTAAAIERALGTRCTSRNWNTVRKLDQMATA